MPDLSVLIPARSEMFLARTVEGVLKNIRGDTEIIIVADGGWPDPPVRDHKRVHMIHRSEAVGQRAATNEAARLSEAEFVMKLDAHCIVDEGFDVKLMAECGDDWTVVPRMFNLHAFNWVCKECGHKRYQGRSGECGECGGGEEREIVWRKKKSPTTDFMRFDEDLIFRYWGAFKRRPEGQGDICDLMSCIGACWFMRRERYWEIGGLDEEFGIWGQVGTELACKSWMSGGRMVVNKRTWFAHMFRTQGGDFGFPFPLPRSQVNAARKRSRELFQQDNWPGATRKFQWIIDKFAPIPGWHDEPALKKPRRGRKPAKGVVYYTDNRLNGDMMRVCQKRIVKGIKEKHVVSVSLEPVGFGTNVVLGLEPGALTMFKQILAGLEASTDAEVVFFCEHDVLYHKSHFDFVPPEKDVFYYNVNVWKLNLEDGRALRVDDCKQTSGLCAWRDLLLEHYRKRVEMVEAGGFTRKMGFEPGTHGRAERVDDFKAEAWSSEFPNVDLRHGGNMTPNRWSPEKFRNKRFTEGWTMADEIPGWGETKKLLEWLT